MLLITGQDTGARQKLLRRVRPTPTPSRARTLSIPGGIKFHHSIFYEVHHLTRPLYNLAISLIVSEILKSNIRGGEVMDVCYVPLAHTDQVDQNLPMESVRFLGQTDGKIRCYQDRQPLIVDHRDRQEQMKRPYRIGRQNQPQSI